MLAVLDTNIFISAQITPKSNAGKILEEWELGNLEIVISLELLAEIKQAFAYPKVQKYITLTDQELEKYITRIELHSQLVDISETMVEVPTDKNDNHVLATLIASGADWLVSGDSDLLNLQKKYNIITPENFVNKFILS